MISNVVLFTSTTSPSSRKCEEYIWENNLPVTKVRLDTKEQRLRALKGKVRADGTAFRISGVPTLVVTYDDGNFQIFPGLEQSIRWLQAASAQAKNNQPADYEEVEPVKKQKVKKPKKKSKGLYGKKPKKPVEFTYSSSEEEGYESDENEPIYEAVSSPESNKINPNNNPLSTSQNTSSSGIQMRSVMEEVKRMERDRNQHLQSTFGVSESQLPNH